MSKQRQGAAALSTTSSHDEDEDWWWSSSSSKQDHHANQNHDDDDHRDTRLTISSPSLWADSPLHHQSNHLPTPLLHHHDHQVWTPRLQKKLNGWQPISRCAWENAEIFANFHHFCRIFCHFLLFLRKFSVIFREKKYPAPRIYLFCSSAEHDHYFTMMQIENWAKFLSVQKKWFERDEVRLKASVLIMRWKAKGIGSRFLSPFSCPWVVFEMVIQRSMSNIWLLDFTKMKHRIMMIRIWLESLLKMFWLKL